LAEGGIHEYVHNNKVREGSISDATSSMGIRLRDTISLTPEILAMMDMHEPDKDKQAQLLTEHLAGQRAPSSTEEELHQHMERKAKREAKRQIEVEEAASIRQDQFRHAEALRQTQNAGGSSHFCQSSEGSNDRNKSNTRRSGGKSNSFRGKRKNGIRKCRRDARMKRKHPKSIQAGHISKSNHIRQNNVALIINEPAPTGERGTLNSSRTDREGAAGNNTSPDPSPQ
jgi:hypothetical protein